MELWSPAPSGCWVYGAELEATEKGTSLSSGRRLCVGWPWTVRSLDRHPARRRRRGGRRGRAAPPGPGSAGGAGRGAGSSGGKVCPRGGVLAPAPSRRAGGVRPYVGFIQPLYVVVFIAMGFVWSTRTGWRCSSDAGVRAPPGARHAPAVDRRRGADRGGVSVLVGTAVGNLLGWASVAALSVQDRPVGDGRRHGDVGPLPGGRPGVSRKTWCWRTRRHGRWPWR